MRKGEDQSSGRWGSHRTRSQGTAFGLYLHGRGAIGGFPAQDYQAPGPEQDGGCQFRMKNLPEAISKGLGSCWVETAGERQTS